MTDFENRLRSLGTSRWRVAISLTIAMIVVYFGFIALIAYNKPLLGRMIVPGLSIGVLLGVVVILASWALTWIYVWWANNHYDTALDDLKRLQEP